MLNLFSDIETMDKRTRHPRVRAVRVDSVKGQASPQIRLVDLYNDERERTIDFPPTLISHEKTDRSGIKTPASLMYGNRATT